MRDPGQGSLCRMPHGLHLDYSMDFQSRRLTDVAPTFLSPLLPKWVSNILLPERAPFSARPPKSCQEQVPDTEEIPEFQPAWLPTQEEPADFLPEQESTPQEPSFFLPEEDQESSSETKTESRPVLTVKLPFPQKAKKAPEALEEESTVPKEAPSKNGQEMVTISDEDGMSQEAPGPSTSQSTAVPSQKWHLEGQGSASESSTPTK